MKVRVLVVYASRLGATQEIAERIAATLREGGLEATAQAAGDGADDMGADAFVIGSGVYAGHWLTEAVKFVRRNSAVLADRPVWLFSSGPAGTLATKHPPVEPKELADLRAMVHPRDHRIFFGALDRSKVDGSALGFAERVIAKTLVPEGDFRDWGAIEAWAASIAGELVRVPASLS